MEGFEGLAKHHKAVVVDDDLIYGLICSFVSKIQGNFNSKYSETVLNWYRMLESTSSRAFEVASANLLGP